MHGGREYSRCILSSVKVIYSGCYWEDWLSGDRLTRSERCKIVKDVSTEVLVKSWLFWQS